MNGIRYRKLEVNGLFAIKDLFTIIIIKGLLRSLDKFVTVMLEPPRDFFFFKEAEEMSGRSLSKWIAPAIKDLFTILLKDRCKAWISL